MYSVIDCFMSHMWSCSDRKQVEVRMYVKAKAIFILIRAIHTHSPHQTTKDAKFANIRMARTGSGYSPPPLGCHWAGDRYTDSSRESGSGIRSGETESGKRKSFLFWIRGGRVVLV